MAEHHPAGGADPDAEAIAIEAGARRGGGRGRGDHLPGDRRQQRVLLDDAHAVELAAAQHHRHPAGEVAHIGGDAAGGRLRVRLALVPRLILALDLHMADGTVRPGDEIGEARGGRVHAERLVQHLVGQARPVLAVGGGDRLRRGGEAEIGIGIGVAEAGQRQQAQPLQHLLAVVAEIFQHIAGMVRQAGTVGEQIGDGDVLRHPRVRQREPGQVLHHRRVPGDRAGADLMGDHGGGERLRQRGDLEHGVGVDLCRLTILAHAEALGIDGGAVLHHGDRHAGNAGLAHDVAGERIEPVERLLELARRHRHHRELGWRRQIFGERRGSEQEEGGEDGWFHGAAFPLGAPQCAKVRVVGSGRCRRD